MKKIILIIMIAAAFNACKKSNNNTQTTPPGPVAADTLMSWTKSAKLFESINDIWFTSSGTGFLLGSSTSSTTAIYTSPDLGVTWTMVPNTVGINGYNLQFLNDQTGFDQGPSIMAVTTDGGKTWTAKYLSSSKVLYSQFISADIGFYADEDGGISKTVDGGNTWKNVFGYQYAGETFPFYFVDSLHGFTMADGKFSKTTDGGMHWQLISPVVDPTNAGHYYRMQMFDTLAGFCGTSQALLKTIDGGQTWTSSLDGASAFTIVQFIDLNNGYVLMDSSIYKTTDAGSTWNLSCRLGTDKFFGMHFTDMDHGWACTEGGYVLTLK